MFWTQCLALDHTTHHLHIFIPQKIECIQGGFIVFQYTGQHLPWHDRWCMHRLRALKGNPTLVVTLPGMDLARAQSCSACNTIARAQCCASTRQCLTWSKCARRNCIRQYLACVHRYLNPLSQWALAGDVMVSEQGAPTRVWSAQQGRIGREELFPPRPVGR